MNNLRYLLAVCLTLSAASCGMHSQGTIDFHTYSHDIKEKIKPVKKWFKHLFSHKKDDMISPDQIKILEKTQSLKTYEDYQTKSRQFATTTFNNLPMSTQNSEYIYKEKTIPIDLEKSPELSSGDIAALSKKYALVRPVPFPYYAMMTIANNSQQDWLADTFYSQALFARKYGIDTANAFFPVLNLPIIESNATTIPVAFISNVALRPLSHPVTINNAVVDNLPAFLTYYYRGWFDQTATTINPSPSSLLAPTLISAAATGNTKTISMVDNSDPLGFEGLNFTFVLTPPITTAVLRLRDLEGYDHYLMLGAKLAANQQGWEFDLPKTTGEFKVSVDMANEKNKYLLNLLGRPTLGSKKYFKEAALTVYGTNNASIELKTVLPLTFNYNAQTKQNNLLAQYNIFPSQPLKVNSQNAENFSILVAQAIMQMHDFGNNQILANNLNLFDKSAFTELPATTTHFIHLTDLKKLPTATETTLKTLADLKYNLTGNLEATQRIWFPSLSANNRYTTVLQQLPQHTQLNGNTVKIQDWLDNPSHVRIPDSKDPTFDLHGQTFYVPNAVQASVELNGKTLSALKRNAKDITGRESVTVVDLTHPKLFFDKLDPIENHYARIEHTGASLFYQAAGATPGKYTLQIVSDKIGSAFVAIKPYLFDNYETDFFRFIVKKSRPDLQIFIGWKGHKQHLFAASDGKLASHYSSWTLPSYADTQFHDYVVDYSDLNYAKDAPLARGPVEEIQIGILNAKPGDTLTLDRLEFLAAPGIKAEENGFVLGGRVLPSVDHVPVTLTYANKILKTWTERGGWYFFKNIPKDAIVEITAEYKNVPFTPARGRLIQTHRNDIEYHINTSDLRSNSIPRPKLTDIKILPSMQKLTPPPIDAQFDAARAPHTEWAYTGNPMGSNLSYFGDDYTNNFGYMDKDRRKENIDNAYRILLLGYCLEEGLQTPQFHHMNLLLESMLRQKLARNVEVIVAATSSSSISSRWDSIEKYGQLFKPNLVILINNPSSALTMEPTLQERYIGFHHAHPPYALFDFDQNGKLYKTNKDPMYGMHVVQPSTEGITGSVALTHAHVTPEILFPLIERSHQLLEAVISQKYLPLVKSWGGQIALLHSYYPLDFPSDGKNGSNYTLNAVFSDRMQEVCAKTGITCLNLFNTTYRPDYKEIATWEHDSHLTPTGHYLFAKATIEELLPLIKNGVIQ